MSNQKPFFSPLLYPHLQQPAQQQVPVLPPPAQEAVSYQPAQVPDYSTPAPPVGPGHLWCAHCREPLGQGDRCVEILFGKVGRGFKSGQAMVVPDEKLEEDFPGTNNPILCWDCVIAFVDQELYGGSYFENAWMESQELYEPIDEDR